MMGDGAVVGAVVDGGASALEAHGARSALGTAARPAETAMIVNA